VKLLLDTHVWIWSQESPEALGPAARTSLLDGDNELFVSTISTLEIARLAWLGRVSLSMELMRWVTESLRLLGAGALAVTHEEAVEAYRLPEPFHRDPADRILIATARTQVLRLVTADDSILSYPGVQALDARV
jgi:PIN domain nuclease of toxin-antitoxin system